MTTHLVLDTSVVIKWFQQEERLAARALALRQDYLTGQVWLLEPALLAYELANMLRYKAALSTAQVETAVQSLFDMQLEWFAPTAALTRRAASLARLYDTSVYDAIFAALAESAAATFVTADERLVRRLAPLTCVAFLGDLEIPA